MVTFDEKGFTIRVETGGGSVEEWQQTFFGLLDILYFVRSESICDDTYCSVINLMREMLPDYKTLQKMTK